MSNSTGAKPPGPCHRRLVPSQSSAPTHSLVEKCSWRISDPQTTNTVLSFLWKTCVLQMDHSMTFPAASPDTNALLRPALRTRTELAWPYRGDKGLKAPGTHLWISCTDSTESSFTVSIHEKNTRGRRVALEVHFELMQYWLREVYAVTSVVVNLSIASKGISKE